MNGLKEVVELFKKIKLLHFQGINPPLHPQGHLIPLIIQTWMDIPPTLQMP